MLGCLSVSHDPLGTVDAPPPAVAVPHDSDVPTADAEAIDAWGGAMIASLAGPQWLNPIWDYTRSGSQRLFIYAVSRASPQSSRRPR